ncbi:hypothetical protein TcCL_Unassigned04816 [Trypanosoma cruzi]|nr:hypothetical protein TcCL_Unassigned04816 [Trypanosoma cruzi]
MRAAPHLSFHSQSFNFTAGTRAALHRRDYKQGVYESTGRTIDVDSCPPCLIAATVLLYPSFLCVPCARMMPLLLCNADPREGETAPSLLANGEPSTPLPHHHFILGLARWLPVVTLPRGCLAPCVSSTASGLPCGRTILLQERCQWSCVFFWDLTTLHGGCVGLRGRWEGDVVTGLTAFARICVGVSAFVGIVRGRMPLRAAVFSYCCYCLFLF